MFIWCALWILKMKTTLHMDPQPKQADPQPKSWQALARFCLTRSWSASSGWRRSSQVVPAGTRASQLSGFGGYSSKLKGPRSCSGSHSSLQHECTQDTAHNADSNADQVEMEDRRHIDHGRRSVQRSDVLICMCKR